MTGVRSPDGRMRSAVTPDWPRRAVSWQIAPMAIAFFDLDRTILAINSGSGWVKSEYRDGFITRWQVLRASAWLLRYHLGFADMEGVLREALAAYAGHPESELRARTRRFYAAAVRDQIRPGARDALEQHRTDGEKLVLLTTASNYLSEAVGETLPLDDWLCSRFEVDGQGRLTGEPVVLCYGKHKVDLATEWADREGVELADCAFYSDSFTDLPMLEAVGRPVVVDPDPRLRRVARRRGWPIADWGLPDATR